MHVYIFERQGTKAIMERSKEQVQGNLVVAGVETGGKQEKSPEKTLSCFRSICDYLQP